MIHVKKTENGVMGFGSIETVEDVEKLIENLAEILGSAGEELEPEVEPAPHDDLLDALMDALGWGEDDECDCDECECDREDEDIDADEEEWDEFDGLPHVVSVGYTHDFDEVVIMNDRDTKWGLAEAFLRAAAKVWPVEDEQDEKLKGALLELAGVAHEHVDPDD